MCDNISGTTTWLHSQGGICLINANWLTCLQVFYWFLNFFGSYYHEIIPSGLNERERENERESERDERERERSERKNLKASKAQCYSSKEEIKSQIHKTGLTITGPSLQTDKWRCGYFQTQLPLTESLLGPGTVKDAIRMSVSWDYPDTVATILQKEIQGTERQSEWLDYNHIARTVKNFQLSLRR